MTRPVGLTLIVFIVVMFSIPAHAELLQPAHVFTLRDFNNDGSVDDFADVPPQIGVPTVSGGLFPASLDLHRRDFCGIQHWQSRYCHPGNLELSGLASGPGGVAALPVATYSGSGKTNTLLYRTAGNPWQTLQVPAPQPGGFCCTFNVDVTGLYNQFKNSGFTHLGFRLHDPVLEWAAFARAAVPLTEPVSKLLCSRNCLRRSTSVQEKAQTDSTPKATALSEWQF